MSDLVSRIQKVLAEADLVLGWTASGAGGTAAPARFHDAGEAEAAIFDSTCVHNLAVHLPRLKDRTVGIVAKACDASSVVAADRRARDRRGSRCRIIDVTCRGGARCQDHLAPARLRRRRSKMTAATCASNGDQVDRENSCFRQSASVARERRPVIDDEVAGDESLLRSVPARTSG